MCMCLWDLCLVSVVLEVSIWLRRLTGSRLFFVVVLLVLISTSCSVCISRDRGTVSKERKRWRVGGGLCFEKMPTEVCHVQRALSLSHSLSFTCFHILVLSLSNTHSEWSAFSDSLLREQWVTSKPKHSSFRLDIRCYRVCVPSKDDCHVRVHSLDLLLSKNGIRVSQMIEIPTALYNVCLFVSVWFVWVWVSLGQTVTLMKLWTAALPPVVWSQVNHLRAPIGRLAPAIGSTVGVWHDVL